MKYGKFINRAEDVPSVEHWAIIESSSYYTAESGVWAPGHGYPASTTNYITYEAFLNEADFKEVMESRLNTAYSYGRKEIRGVHVIGTYSPKTTITVQVVELPATDTSPRD